MQAWKNPQDGHTFINSIKYSYLESTLLEKQVRQAFSGIYLCPWSKDVFKFLHGLSNGYFFLHSFVSK